MTIAPETEAFARQLVVTEETSRQAVKHAAGLFKALTDWTGSDAVQAIKPNPPSHIDMAAHAAAFGEGVNHLAQALGVICTAHVVLKKFCEDNKIDIPDIPTTRSGGGR